MKQRPRIYCSEGQRAMMWDRWQRGESLHDIARLFDRAIPRFSGFCLRAVGYVHRHECVHV